MLMAISCPIGWAGISAPSFNVVDVGGSDDIGPLGTINANRSAISNAMAIPEKACRRMSRAAGQPVKMSAIVDIADGLNNAGRRGGFSFRGQPPPFAMMAGRTRRAWSWEAVHF